MSKSSILFLVVMGACSLNSAFSQTLSFSQVLLVTSSQTVPAGHVWKIENILPTDRLAVANTLWDGITLVDGVSNFDKVIVVNSQNIIVHSTSSTTSVQDQTTSNTSSIRSSNAGYGLASGILDGPIWLPAGTTLAAGTGVYAVSVLEFEVN
jgi:hypothetical protein